MPSRGVSQSSLAAAGSARGHIAERRPAAAVQGIEARQSFAAAAAARMGEQGAEMQHTLARDHRVGEEKEDEGAKAELQQAQRWPRRRRRGRFALAAPPSLQPTCSWWTWA